MYNYSVITLTKLQSILDGYLQFDKKLDTAKIDPYMANGLMVKGREDVRKIGFGVSASISLFEKAKKEGCNAIVVHHAFNFPPYNKYDQIFQNRIGYLIKNEISLFGYHFLLDAHPEIGNNVEILKSAGFKPMASYDFHCAPWGYEGKNEKGILLTDIVHTLESRLSSRTILYDYGTKLVHRAIAVSGSGAAYPVDMAELINKKIDLYITGEPREWNRELFREARINFIAGGHYSTETFGIKALMNNLMKKLSHEEVVWIDLINEV